MSSRQLPPPEGEALISFVLPVYNESAGIVTFHEEILLPALEAGLRDRFEIIYVNDGSSDDSLRHLTAIAEGTPAVRVVNLSRNFGKEIATSAGIAHARGDATMILDSDGQHPPELVGRFLDKWRSGAQVVVGVRQSNQNEGIAKRLGSKMFYRLLNSISEMRTVPRSTDFRLIDRDVRREFLRFTERNRITRGLIDWLGFERDYVEFHAPARIAGEASYTIGKLVRLALNSFTTMSLRPLFFFGYLGVAITLLSLISGLFIIFEQFILGDPLLLNITGAAMLGIFVSFLVGIVLSAQGMMALYLSHIHAETQHRPLFVIDRARSIGLISDDDA